jgi:hypothetical protein
MKRVVFAALVSVLAGALTACPPPPPGYQPPRIESVDVSPQPARPGDTLSVRIEATDDQAVTGGVVSRVHTPSGTWLDGVWLCDVETVPTEPGDRTRVVMTISCPVPAVANNGTWRLEIRVNDGYPPAANYPGLQTTIPFEVTGGTDDREPPRLITHDIEPEVVDQETAFTLTMRLQDEAMPIRVGQGGSDTFNFTKPFAQNSTFRCSSPTYTPVSSTEVDVVVQCRPMDYDRPGRSEVGLHRAVMQVQDALRHQGNVEMIIDVQPAPAG